MVLVAGGMGGRIDGDWRSAKTRRARLHFQLSG